MHRLRLWFKTRKQLIDDAAYWKNQVTPERVLRQMAERRLMELQLKIRMFKKGMYNIDEL